MRSCGTDPAGIVTRDNREPCAGIWTSPRNSVMLKQVRVRVVTVRTLPPSLSPEVVS